MQPDSTGQVSAKWGDPETVQKFRNALIPQIGQKAADDYINQYQTAFQRQQTQNTNQTVFGQTAGGITPDQALKDPVAAQKFMASGGQVVDPISNIAKSVILGDMTLADISDPTQKAQVDAVIRKQGLDVNRLPNDPQARATKDSMQSILDRFIKLPETDKGPAGQIYSLNPLSAGHNYDATRRGLTESLAPSIGPGKGNGLRLNKDVIAGWQELLPKGGQTTQQNQDDLVTLDQKFHAVTGQHLDPEYFAAFGITTKPLKNGKFTYKEGNMPSENTSKNVIQPAPGQNNGIPGAIGNILQNAPKDAGNIVSGLVDIPNQMLNGQAPNPMDLSNMANPLTALLHPESMAKTVNYVGNGVANYASNLNKDLGQPLQNGDVMNRAGQNLQQRPVSTVMDLLPFLAAGKGAIFKGGDVAGGAVDTTATIKNPSLIQKIINPEGINKNAANLRNTIIDTAESSGKTMPNSTILSDIKSEIPKLKRGNLGQGKVIDQAMQDAAQAFEAKGNMTPKEMADAYQETGNGYTKDGTPKTHIQANIDRAMRKIYEKRLDEVTDGQWSKSTKMFSQGYEAQKSAPAKAVKGIPGKAVGAALNAAGLGILGKLFGL